MISNKPKLTEFHYHEALDRASVLLDGIDRHLIQHPVCKLDKEVAELVEEAAVKMYEAYQLLGDRSCTLFP
jgi:hypothetical protein|tara:strand:+ start:1301 stop:1513 length:213 start_codon:yes stop_codon:yes gene_type:complete